MRTNAEPRYAVILAVVVVGLVAPAAFGRNDGVESIDLTQFLALVEANSLQLERARTDRLLTEVQRDLVFSQAYPSVVGKLGYTRNFLDVETPLPVAASTTAINGVYPLIPQQIDTNRDNDFTVGFSLNQRLFDAGVFRAMQASQQLTSLAGSTYTATRHGLLTEAKRLFFQTLLLQAVLAVRRSSEAIALAGFAEAQQRFANGLASQLELLQAEVDWKITQPDTSQAERNFNVAVQNLKNFASLAQDQAIDLVGSLDEFPPLPDFDGAFENRATRPDYQVLLAARRLRELNIVAKRAAFYPTVSAALNYGWKASDDGFNLNNGVNVLSGGLTMTVPIFLGGSRAASLNQTRLELNQTNTEIAMFDDTIAAELETVRLRLEEAVLRIESAAQTRATVERALQVSQTSVDNGLATQRELNDTRVNLERAQLSYLSAVFDYLSAYFDWQLATGIGDQEL